MMYSNQLVCSIKVNGKILREKIQDGNSSVFIPFGSEYSLIFKNLSGRNAVVHAEIDGRDINAAKQGFYLQAGRTIELEGFEKNYKTERHFKFIQKTSEISDFRGDRIDDGMIRITWQFEKEIPEIVKKTIVHEHIHHNHHWPWHSYYHFGCNCPFCSPYHGGIVYRGGMYGGSIGSSQLGSNTGENIGNYTATNSIDLKSENINACLRSDGGRETIQSLFNKCSDGEKGLLMAAGEMNAFNDNGITVEGSKSNQSFGQANPSQLEENVHSMVIILKGCKADQTQVTQPLTVHSKIQCSSCGRKWKGNIEFCPKCGTAIK